jgi:Glyoxalase-like domain
MAVARLASVALDCGDPHELASFWSELLGAEIAFSSDDFVAIRTDSLWLTAVRTEDYQPPTWPGGSRPKHVHLDLAVQDLDEAETAAVALGAEKTPEQPSPDRWRVLLDPAGHPFCLSSLIPG